MGRRKTIKGGDVITGSEGMCFAIIDGNNEPMIYVVDIEATIKKKKKEFAVLGQPGKKHKAGGWSGSGKMKLRYATSLYRKMMLQYVKDGIDTYFNVLVENEDPTSSIGKQSVLLKGVNLDEVVIAKLDAEAEQLDEDISFTFHDVDMLDEFDSLEGE